jgi:hypothetical protein
MLWQGSASREDWVGVVHRLGVEARNVVQTEDQAHAPQSVLVVTQEMQAVRLERH